MENKIYKCPFCNRRYLEKSALYAHMENEHSLELDNLPAAQIYFNYKNKYKYALTNGFGKSVLSGKPTKFNLTTERYEKYASEEEKKEAREIFKKNMMARYGKTTLLDEPEQQKLMLSHRSISNTYTWDNGEKTLYTGSYEKAFLEFLNLNYDWANPSDVMAPAPMSIYYKDSNNKDRFHIPDFYIQSLNLIVNIKSSTNMGYRLRDIEDEKLQDKAIQETTNYNYIKIYDNDFKDFVKIVSYFRSLDAGEKEKRICIY